jgi:hypothetical protein
MALGYNRLDFQETYPPVEAPHLGKNVDKEPEDETFGTLYPNFYFCSSSQSIELAIVLPEGPEKTHQKSIYLFEKDIAQAKEALEERLAVSDLYAAAEDGLITKACQKAKKSPVYQQKFYAPFWDEMHHYFTNLVVDDLER